MSACWTVRRKRAKGELEREALLARRIERRTEQAATNNAMEFDAVGTEVAGLNIPVAEALRRLRLRLCMRCGELGHNASNCSDKLIKENPSAANKQGKKLYLWAQVLLPSALRSRQIGLMVDCGADSNFVDEAVVSSMILVTKPRKCPIAVIGVDECPIESEIIRNQIDLTLQLWDADGRPIVQEIRFNVIKSPKHPFILGLPWLKLTQPVIDWAEMVLTWPRGTGLYIPRVIKCGNITVAEAGMVETRDRRFRRWLHRDPPRRAQFFVGGTATTAAQKQKNFIRPLARHKRNLAHFLKQLFSFNDLFKKMP